MCSELVDLFNELKDFCSEFVDFCNSFVDICSALVDVWCELVELRADESSSCFCVNLSTATINEMAKQQPDPITKNVII